MKTLKCITLLLLTTLFFASCKKDTDPVKPDNSIDPPTAEQFSKLREAALEKQTQKFIIDLDTSSGDQIKLTSKNGTEIKISKGSLYSDGNPVTGKIEIRFTELYDAGHMLITNKITMGLDDDGHLVPITTGGAFHINVLKDGEPIDSSGSITLIVPAQLTGGIDNDMVLWHGDTDNQGNLTWVKIDPNTQRGALKAQSQDTTYYAIFNQFGWTNIDRFMNYNGTKTKLEVKVPQGFNDSNSVVYLKYKGEPNALARLDKYESNNKIFTEHYGWIPIGEECHIIFASASSDGKWLIAIKKNIIIEANKIYEFKTSDTQIVNNNAEVVQMINDLP